MADLDSSRAQEASVVLVAIPDGARAAAVARALAAERLMPVMAFTGAALVAFAADQAFAAVVLDPAIDDRTDPVALLETVRATTPAPIVALGYVPGDGPVALSRGIGGLLGVDASAADVVGTVVTAIAHDDQSDEVVAYGELVVDLRNFEAWRGTRRLSLTPTELRVLCPLVAAQGDLVTKRTLQQAAWGSASPHDDNRLQAHIRRLRRKLDDAFADGDCRVRTVRGLGFRLDHAAPDHDGQMHAGAFLHEQTETDREPSRSHR